MMHSSSSQLKQDFLKRWIKGLQTYSSSFNRKMTIVERRNAIKLSADVAIAATRSPSTLWSQAVMAGAAAKNSATKTLVRQITGKAAEYPTNVLMIKYSNKILRRSRRTVMAKKKAKARRVVRRSNISMVKERTGVLKRLVPGGNGIKDEACLIRETLDYIASLRVQVDVMRLLVGLDQQ